MFGFGDFFAAVRDPPDTAEHHAAERNEVRDAGEHAVSEHGQRVARKVGAIAELFEGHAREKQDGCASDFVQAIDVVDVFAGVVVETLFGFRDEFVALTELGGARRTGLGAGGRLPCLHAVGAHSALLHFRKQLAPFVFRNTEGAGSHTVAASHAARFFVDHGAFGSFAKSGDRTYGSAGGIGAVHAEAPHVFFALGENNGVFVFG